MVTKRLSVVTGEDDQSVFPLTGCLQMIQQTTKLVIDLLNRSVI